MSNDILEFLATKEVMIVLIIIGVVLVAYIVLWFIGFMKKHEAKKKLQNNTMELNKLVEQVALANKENNETIETVKEIIEPVVKEEPKIEPVQIEEKPPVEAEAVVKQQPQITIERGFTTPIEVQPIIIKEPPKEINNNIEPTLSNIYTENSVITNNVPEAKETVEEDIIKYKDEVYTKTEAKKELERLTEELKKAETEEIEESNNIQLTKFEEEQEENAIISLEELLEKGKSATLSEEIAKYEDEGDEPISLSELEARYKESKEQVEVLDIEEPKEEKPKVSIDDFLGAPSKPVMGPVKPSGTYKPSPIISPVYGIEKDNSTHASPNNLSLEDTATYEKLDEEIRKNNEFLSKLRELQEKLD